MPTLRQAVIPAALVAALAGALPLLGGCTGTRPVPVRTDTVRVGDVTATVSAGGSLTAIGTQNLGFPKGGKLTSVRVKVGQKVTVGQVLAVVDDTATRQALEQAEANLRAQQAGLDRIRQATTVSGAQSTLVQSRSIVQATRGQVDATTEADQTAITRAQTQLDTDEDAEDEAEKAVRTVKAACSSASTGAAQADAATATLTQQAQQQLQNGDSAGAAQTLAQLNRQLAASAAASGSATACTQVLTAQAAVTAAKQRVVADRTALVGARQKKKVDAAAGRLAIANAEQAEVSAENGLDASSSDRPNSIAQQQALVDSAEAAVTGARKDQDNTRLRAPVAGTVTAVNGSKGEYVGASSGVTAQAPGSRAAIPGASSAGAAAAATSPSRPGGTQFLVLSDVSKLQLVVPVEQSDAAQLKIGQRASISVDALPGKTLRGHVAAQAPSSTATSGAISYYVTVALDDTDARLRDGQTARLAVLTVDRRQVLTVPNSSVQSDGSTTTVALLNDDGSQQTVPIETGAVGADRTEVRSGLTAGQRVVLPTGASR